MRDDFAAPNLGQAADEYDKQFFYKSYRDIEQWMSRLLSKGPLNLSDLKADAATINKLTVTGTISLPSGGDLTTVTDLLVTGSASFGGTVIVSGATTLGAMSASSIAVSGTSALHSTTVTGTLGVTGNTTIGGTLGVTGATTLATVSATTGTFSGDVNAATGMVTAQIVNLPNTGSILFCHGPGQIDGTLTLGGQVQLNSGALKFPATAIPDGNANTLDDYEEGTWTPGYASNTGAFGAIGYDAAANRYGTYIKIGRLVFVTGRLRTLTLAVGTASGQCKITGLPFTSTVISHQGNLLANYSATWTNYPPIGAWVISGTSTAYLYGKTSAIADSASIIQSNFVTTSGNDIIFGGMYIADS